MNEIVESKPAASPADAPQPHLAITGSRHFVSWLNERKVSLAFTTYQAGKFFLIGLKADGQMSVFERSIERCMGLCSAGNSLWLSSLYQLWRFENVLDPGVTHDG